MSKLSLQNYNNHQNRQPQSPKLPKNCSLAQIPLKTLSRMLLLPLNKNTTPNIVKCQVNKNLIMSLHIYIYSLNYNNGNPTSIMVLKIMINWLKIMEKFLKRNRKLKILIFINKSKRVWKIFVLINEKWWLWYTKILEILKLVPCHLLKFNNFFNLTIFFTISTTSTHTDC